MGYTGGTTENPTYRNMGDHTESIQIDYDPETISYEQLLDIFWKNHNPSQQHFFRDRQYMSLVVYYNHSQKVKALKSKENLEVNENKTIYTEFQPYSTFYIAENYHQKYLLKRYKNVIASLEKLYSTHDELINGTMTARLNGFVRGKGSLADLKEEVKTWNISDERKATALEVLHSLRW